MTDAQAALNPFAGARSATSLAPPKSTTAAKDGLRADGRPSTASAAAAIQRSWLPVFNSKAAKKGKNAGHSDPDAPAPRTVYASVAAPGETPDYPTNEIRTSKYSLLLFVPKNLSEQFRRVANIFFLTLAVIQFFPVFMTIDPVVSALPLIIIVTLTMIKDGLEDYRRHASDNKVNSTPVYALANFYNVNVRPPSQALWHRFLRWWERILGYIMLPIEYVAALVVKLIKSLYRWLTAAADKVTGGELGKLSGNADRPASPVAAAPKFVPPTPDDPDDPHFAIKQWSEVKVGDFLLLREGDSVPADLLLLSSSEPESVAYLETKNLDGETNLKIRYSVPSTQHLRTALDCADARFWVESEEANANMYSFSGTLVAEGGRDQRLPVSSPGRRSLRKKTDGGSWASFGKSSFVAQLETVEEAPESPLAQTPVELSGLAVPAQNGPDPASLLAALPPVSPGSAQSTSVEPPTAASARFQPAPPPNPPLSAVTPGTSATSLPSVAPSIASAPQTGTAASDGVLHLKILPVNAGNLLLRGSVLRDTEWAIGFVVFTGSETKVVMNSGKTPSKRSAIEKMMNYHVLVNLFILACICIVVAVANPIWEAAHLAENPPYLAQAAGTGFTDGLIAFLNALIQYQNIVPISLYLTVEIVKTAQAFFIYQDVEMYYEPMDRPCIPRAWNLSDDLGQIEYVFSDKTGTLTRNVMEFKKCTIAGTLYAGLGEPPPGAPRKSQSQAQANLSLRRMSTDPRKSVSSMPRASVSAVGLGVNGGWEPASPQPAMLPTSERHRSSASMQYPAPRRPSPARSSASIRNHGQAAEALPPLPATPSMTPQIPRASPSPSPSPAPDAGHEMYQVPAQFPSAYRDAAPGFVDPKLYQDLEAPTSTAPQSVLIMEFFTLLAVCHSVLVSTPDGMPAQVVEGAEGPSAEPAGPLHYRAQSPDEAALVVAAKNFGIAFVAREQNGIVLDVFGEERVYEVLNVLEFNSDRKRMSVIVRRPDDTIVVYCKGADAVMYERLAADQKQVMERTTEHLDYFAEQGLRTLVLAYRELHEDDYQEWQARYHEASLALVGREAKVDACAAEIERDLVLLGSTAIEDKLQDGVPEAIATMLQAGIHVCVLTGDKMETAINIGFSCNLLDKSMHVITVKGFKEEATEAPAPGTPLGDVSPTMKQIREALESFVRPYHEPWRSKNMEGVPPRLALVIDGLALKTALEGYNADVLLELITHCAAVICCRVSPLQKAQVVELVKLRKQVMCLAIGDGANDVSMIQSADIGVGIAGEEGLQAVAASDYAIAQFRFLTRLLLVHGHWNYRRTAEMVFTFFYKNLIITIPLFLYQFYCGFSNSYIIDFNYLLFYQTFFTALSVIGLGIFDRDLDARYVEDVPPLHIYGIKQHWFNARRFWLFMFEGFMQSIILYFFVIAAYGEEIVQANGQISDQFQMGTTMAIAAIVNANLFVGINSSSWTWPQVVCIGVGIVAIFAYVPIYSQSVLTYAWGQAQQVFGSMVFWMTFLLVTVAMQGPRLTYLYYFRNYWPTDINIIEEVQKYKMEDELEWAIETSRPPDDSDEHYVPAPPSTLSGSVPASPSIALQPHPGVLRAPSYPLAVAPPVLVAAPTPSDLPETAAPTSAPPNVNFMSTISSAASVPGLPEEALRVTRGTSANIRDMQTDTIVPHRGFSFSQGRGASIIILGARIKEKLRRTMSRTDRSSIGSNPSSSNNFFGVPPSSARSNPTGGDDRRLSALAADANFVRSLPTLDILNPGSPAERMPRAESSPTSSRTAPLQMQQIPAPASPQKGVNPVTTASSAGSLSLPAGAQQGGSTPMASLDTVAGASEGAVAGSQQSLSSNLSSVVMLSPLPVEGGQGNPAGPESPKRT